MIVLGQGFTILRDCNADDGFRRTSFGRRAVLGFENMARSRQMQKLLVG